MNLYQLKRSALRPYIWFMRRRERERTGFIKGALELHYYRPTFYRFMRAFIENPEILHEAPVARGGVILDFGAFDGEWAAQMFQRYGARMDLFEPNPGPFSRLVARFSGNDRIRLFQCGLLDEDTVLNLRQQGMDSTVFAAGERQPGRSVAVQLRDAARVLDELGHDEIDLLKINIEGGEFEVLERLLAVDRVRGIRCLLLQFHEWRDGAHGRRRSIRRALRRTHRLVWDYPFVWEKWVRR